jgi:hypothetical protein
MGQAASEWNGPAADEQRMDNSGRHRTRQVARAAMRS